MRRKDGDVRDRERLAHMLKAASDAVAIAAGRSRHELDRDIMLQHALVHCVEVIGEAAARVTEAGRARAPDLPWPKIVGMRHILVHAYYKIDYDAVWRVVIEDIPAMTSVLEKALVGWSDASGV